MLSSVKIELFIKIAVCIIDVLIFNPMANIHLNVFNFFNLPITAPHIFMYSTLADCFS